LDRYPAAESSVEAGNSTLRVKKPYAINPANGRLNIAFSLASSCREDAEAWETRMRAFPTIARKHSGGRPYVDAA
jgi:hypothetical protein